MMSEPDGLLYFVLCQSLNIYFCIYWMETVARQETGTREKGVMTWT